ncbi:MAG TPA: cupin domain-containing protein [Candidatus Aquabacterium excrementipullorum]|nr:cupin domain-containing protein [Candidatus Aquabacterium excrementipullorum]
MSHTLRTGNLWANALPPPEGERFDTLLAHGALVVERIVSSSRIASAPYVQTQDEWVVLLQGQAVLDVAGQSVALAAGDHLFLPAHTPHTVLSVSEGALWLAVHLHPGGAPPASASSTSL